jgi:hypothetical protein
LFIDHFLPLWPANQGRDAKRSAPCASSSTVHGVFSDTIKKRFAFLENQRKQSVDTTSTTILTFSFDPKEISAHAKQAGLLA